MKVLLIDVNCKYSSTGKIVYDLYTELNNEGHTAAICYGRGSLVDGKNIYKFSSNIEVYTHALLTRITGLTGNYSYFATQNLIKFIDDFKPDVVHIHELHAYFVNIAPVMNYLKKNNIKTVWTFHCEFMYTGKCGHANECEKWKTECHKCPQLHEYPKSLVFDFTRKMFNEKKELFSDFNNLTIVTPSKWLANRVRQAFLKEKDIEVVHNGIDTKNTFYPRDYQYLKAKHGLKDEKIVLALAPDLMSEAKGGNWVLQIAKKFKNGNYKFILIGVEKTNQKFDENVIALGRTSNQIELAGYYTMADVFIICSKRENFPTTCLEALSCGTPIVGFDGGGTKETANNEVGRFMAYGDIESLADELKSVISDKEAINISRKCRVLAENNYDKSIMINNYFKLYGIK